MSQTEPTLPPVAPEARRIVPTAATEFGPYDPYGTPVEGLSWLPLNFDRESGCGFYLLRFAPGAGSRPHEHVETEEFLVLEGELIDHDGTVFRTGDHVTFAPGTKHWSHAPSGCVLAVTLRGYNRALTADD